MRCVIATLLKWRYASAEIQPSRIEDSIVNAIKEVRKYLEKNAGSPSAEVLSRLTAAIAGESQFPLGELYELDREAFDSASSSWKDWRLDRYYAARIRLFDVVLNGKPAESVAAAE